MARTTTSEQMTGLLLQIRSVICRCSSEETCKIKHHTRLGRRVSFSLPRSLKDTLSYPHSLSQPCTHTHSKIYLGSRLKTSLGGQGRRGEEEGEREGKSQGLRGPTLRQ